jgi:hypothetical protein
MPMKTTRYRTFCSRRTVTRRIPCTGLILAILACWTASARTLYVWQDSPNPTPPFDSWGNAATNIQDAVDAAVDGDAVLVAGGVYSNGGRAIFGTMTNRVAVDKAITVESLMGPEVTVIEGAPVPGSGDTSGNGDGAIRCVYLGTNAVLSGFTLTNGHTRTNADYDKEQRGGGAWCESSGTLTNCVITGNSAFERGGGGYGGTLYGCVLTRNTVTDRGVGLFISQGGGGSYGGTLHNCTLSGNRVATFGGGASGGTLYNCTLTGNSAYEGGGAWFSTLSNCTLTGNSADAYGGGSDGGTLYNCTLTSNSAGSSGGGASGGTFYNCTLTGNSANSSGGADDGTLYNCIVYFNTAETGSNYLGRWVPSEFGTYWIEPTFYYSCTTPLPSDGTNNIAVDPRLITGAFLSQ